MAEKLTRLFSQDDIGAAVRRLAGELDRDYRGRSPVLVGALKGAFVFLADLVRQLETPIRSIEFLRLSSYGSGTVTAGVARVVQGLPAAAVKGQDVILVEDIVDTGISAAAALRYLERRRPASVRLCALLDKPSRRQVPVTVHYLGLTVPDVFVVGYGIDKAQRYRQLPDLHMVSG